MKKLLLIFITSLFLNSLKLYSQSYTAFDGAVFTIGDSLTIGLPSNKNTMGDRISYKYIKSYDADYKGYVEVKKNLTHKKFPIKEINNVTERFKGDFNDNAKLLEIGEHGFLKMRYYVDINNAIKNGEIILSLKPNNNKRKIFTDTLTYIYYANTSNKTIDNFTKDYLIRFKNDLYTKTHNDEFEFHKSLNLAKKEIKDTYSNFDFEQEFFIVTELEVENYNFEKNGFPINIKELTVIGVEKSFFTDIKLITINFPNFNEFNFINIESEKANSFIKRRKNSSGNVDRTIYLKIYFNLIQNFESEEQQENTIYGNINRIEFYDFEHCLYNWLGTSKKQSIIKASE